MIRINLLATERPTKQRRAAASGGGGGPSGIQAYLLLGLFGGGMAALCAFAWAIETAKIKGLDSDITKAEDRQRQLAAIKAQADAFEAKKRMLDAKVALIEQLKNMQGGPVHLLDEISKALPDFVWLTNLEQNGTQIRIVGQSTGLPAVADFITNLQQSGDQCGKPNPQDKGLCYFPRVDLAGSKENEGVVSFTLQADFQNADAVAKARAAAAEAAPTPPAAPPAPPKKP